MRGDGRHSGLYDVHGAQPLKHLRVGGGVLFGSV